MKNLFLFTALASLNITPAFAQSDYMTEVVFYGNDPSSVKSECHAIETTVREQLQRVEKQILGSEKNLINVKANAVHEESFSDEGGSFISDYCELSFISFTEALGFEKTKLYQQKHLGNKSNARSACKPSVQTALEADKNIVYAKSSRHYRPLNGGHQCEVTGIRVVQMLTN